MNLLTISWPVFRLGEHQPTEEGGLVYYSKQYVDLDDDTTRVGLRVVDDHSVPGDSLARRRLVLAQDPSVNLFPIKRALYFLVDMIKMAKATTWFIDSAGKVFQYKKSTRAKLTCHRVTKVLPGTGLGSIVELERIPTRFKTMFTPKPETPYAGVLQWGLGYILYGFYEEPFKPSHRLV